MSKRRQEQNEPEFAFLLIQTIRPETYCCASQSGSCMEYLQLCKAGLSITSVYLKAAADHRDLKVMQIKTAHVVSFQLAEADLPPVKTQRMRLKSELSAYARTHLLSVSQMCMKRCYANKLHTRGCKTFHISCLRKAARH